MAAGSSARAEESVQAAASAGLDYSSDQAPGWSRRRHGRGFSYRDEDDSLINDPAARERIRQLVIPPAWTDVWICPSDCGHIQATGRDERGRKQYLYHPQWRETRDTAKFGGLTSFSERLPALRSRLARDLRAGTDTEYRTVLAAIVSLLDRTLIRVGNDQYAVTNGSFGLTTLQDDHAEFGDDELRLSFLGKSGKEHEISLRNRRLTRIVRSCQELPGQRLFQYEDEDGNIRAITSAEVNEYLRQSTGPGHSAKDFRTWAGTVIAAGRLHELGEAGSPTAARRNLAAAIRTAAARLGNTVAVCRASYVHPRVQQDYLDGTFTERYAAALGAAREHRKAGLRLEEDAVLRLLG